MLRQKEVAAKKRNVRLAIIAALTAAAAAVYIFVVKPSMEYSNAEKLLAAGQYDAASAAFANMGDYKDAASRIFEPYYVKGTKLLGEGKYEAAISAFNASYGYGDSAKQIAECE